MNTKSSLIHWILLFLTLPLMGLLGWMDVRLPISDLDHRLLELAILAVIYWLINRWISANPRELMGLRSEAEKKRTRQYIIRDTPEAPRSFPEPTGYDDPLIFDRNQVGHIHKE